MYYLSNIFFYIKNIAVLDQLPSQKPNFTLHLYCLCLNDSILVSGKYNVAKMVKDLKIVAVGVAIVGTVGLNLAQYVTQSK